MKMKKNLMMMGLASVAVLVSVFAYMNKGRMASSRDISLLNAEILAETEHIGGGYYSNFIMAKVWYRNGYTIQFSEPFFSFGWTAIDCCVNSIDANACDFSRENSVCATNIVRAARQ